MSKRDADHRMSKTAVQPGGARDAERERGSQHDHGEHHDTAPDARSPQHVHIAGEPMELHGDRALYWPARGRLMIADLHLGKADTFRRAGIALPRGGSAHDLARIDGLLQRTGASALWVLGDLLHGALTDTHWRRSWEAWRTRHGSVEIAILSGNHDRALHDAALEVRLLGDAVDDGPFALRHAPDDAPTQHAPRAPASSRPNRSTVLRAATPHSAPPPTVTRLHTLCGHLHPVVRMPGLGRRLPVFWLREHITVLPAFSAFTGGHAITAAAHERLVACIDGHAILLPPARR